MNLEWFFKRWYGPILVVAIGFGSLAGAVWYRLDVPRAGSAVAFNPNRTTTITATAPPETRVVRETVTRTPEPRVETVVKTVEAAPKTLTATVGAPGTPEQRETRTETVTATETATRLLQVEFPRDRGKGNDG